MTVIISHFAKVALAAVRFFFKIPVKKKEQKTKDEKKDKIKADREMTGDVILFCYGSRIWGLRIVFEITHSALQALQYHTLQFPHNTTRRGAVIVLCT